MDGQREQFQGHAIYSLSEIAMSLHRMIRQKYSLPYYIKAEILKLNYYPHSGHCYPELVERENNKIKAEMRAVIWASQYQQINGRFLKITGEPLKENINILCLATLDYSPVHGLTLHIQNIEPVYTLGEMVKNRQLVIEKLKAEQVFAMNKKLLMALLPKRLAVISVETSKGYNDFMKTLTMNQYGYRFHTELFPSVLQGDRAVAGITACLSRIEERKTEFDCVVIVRGGGGDVGLSCYDDYTLARRVATFCLPVLTGIGHATNLSITDMVAHEHNITPTDVAFSLIGKFRKFEETVAEAQKRIFEQARLLIKEQKLLLTEIESNCNRLIAKTVNQHQQKLNTLSQRLIFLIQKSIIAGKQETESLAEALRVAAKQKLRWHVRQLSELTDLLCENVPRFIRNRRDTLANLEEKVQLLHPDNILRRGFSITRFRNRPVTSIIRLKNGDEIITQFYQGEITSVVKSKK